MKIPCIALVICSRPKLQLQLKCFGKGAHSCSWGLWCFCLPVIRHNTSAAGISQLNTSLFLKGNWYNHTLFTALMTARACQIHYLTFIDVWNTCWNKLHTVCDTLLPTMLKPRALFCLLATPWFTSAVYFTCLVFDIGYVHLPLLFHVMRFFIWNLPSHVK